MSEKKFSPLWFSAHIIFQLALLLFVVYRAAPDMWKKQFDSGWSAFALVFLATNLVNCFVEWTIHRYILHAVPFSWVRQLARKHRNHHRLTAIELKQVSDGAGRVIRNRYPIVGEDQYENQSFPWWALGLFWAIFTPLFVVLQLLMPHVPILVGGYVAIAWSTWLYEVFHHIEHLPYPWWENHIQHPRFGPLWTRVYGFHQLHHANVRCNEAVSGFFCLPLADFVFGTYHQPRVLLLDGRAAALTDIAVPPPRRLIQWLDRRVRARESALLRRSERAAGKKTRRT